MLEDSKSSIRSKITIPFVQKYIFWILIFLLPLAIMPFPWDWTERSMSLLILSFSTVILGLEVIKLVWDGKTSILKSTLDIGFFSLLLSMLLSTIFSRDINTSIWGIDGRLGNSLVIFICILLVAISARTFIKNEKDVRYTIFFFLSGFFINNILSIFSFWGINVWRYIPLYKDLSLDSLPMIRSSGMHVLINIINMVLCMGFATEYLIDKKRATIFVLSIIFGIVSTFNIWIYSINQDVALTTIPLVIIILFLLFVLRKMELQTKSSKGIFAFCIVSILVILIPIILLQIPSVSKAIIPESFNLVGQVSLGFDLSWLIAGSVFVGSLLRGVFGMGVDTYPIAYNLYKPLSDNLLAFNQTTFYNAGNEILTQFANGGLVWLLVWLFIGFLVIRIFFTDIKNTHVYGDKSASWRLLVVDLSILIIYISSFLITYSVLLVFLFLTFVSIREIIKESLSKGAEDKLVIKFWAVDLSSKIGDSKSFLNLSILLTVVIAIIFTGILWIWISKGISSIYTLKAESFSVEQNRKYQGEISPTTEEKEGFITSMVSFYSKAVYFDKNNPLYNRKLGLMYLEKIGMEAEKYSSIEGNEDANAKLIKDIVDLRNYAIDATKKSIDFAPSFYANWEVRAKVYTGLVGIGYYDYTSDALSSLEKAAGLNPLNFELYYSMAQIYVLKDEKDNALASLTKVLGINPQHIPSILLAGTLNKEKGNIDIYESYFKVAKELLENYGYTDLDVYIEVTKQLNDINTEKSKGEPLE